MEAITIALAAAFSFQSLLMLTAGVLIGLMLGVIPGVGGMLGMIVLIPITYQLDPFAAIALLLGLASVMTTSDTIPAVLIGVPGTAGAITTIEDGHPLAKQGQAARALGAAYLSSLSGGLIGAVILGLSIPFMRPLILALKTPDFFAISLLGLLFVSLVSGKDALKGLAAMLFGIGVSLIGLDPQTGAERYTGGSLFLWDGLPLVATFLGVFALAELAGLLRRRVIADMPSLDSGAAQIATGFKDVVREWRLVVQGGAIGSLVGAIPGVGVIVIDWIAYGLASRHRRGGPPFGQGNIRGVIAPESANNAKEGGYLIPTIAFGIPGSAGMAILLAALTIHGIEPGPSMLTTDLPITYSMVIYIAVANVIGASICILFTKQLAKVTSIPIHYIVPIALVFVTLAAVQGSAAYQTGAVFLCFGGIGLLMRARHWSRAAFALGFILGPNVERYFGLSYQISGFDWLSRPSVIFATLSLAGLVTMQAIRRRKRGPTRTAPDPSGRLLDAATYLALIGLAVLGFAGVASLPISARLFPQMVAISLAALAIILLLRDRPWIYLRWRTVQDLIQVETIAPAAFVVGSCASLVLLTYLFGYIPATVIYLPVAIVMIRRTVSVGPAILAVALPALLWLVFSVLTSATWPRPLIDIGV